MLHLVPALISLFHTRQGDVGFQGQPGPPGPTGLGEPGPPVRHQRTHNTPEIQVVAAQHFNRLQPPATDAT